MLSLSPLALTAMAVLGLVRGQAPAPNSWQALAPIPLGTLQEHSTVALSDSLLATVGGLIEGGTTTSAVLLYDIPANAWKRAAPLPLALNHPNAAALDGKLYVLGGLESFGGVYRWRAVPNVWAYDPATDAWTERTSMPAGLAMGSAAVGVHNGTVYLAGGIPGTGGRTLDAAAAYDVAADRWLTLPAAAARLPAPRDHCASAVVGGRMFVLGGRDSGITTVRDTVFVLDLEDLAAGWTTSKARLPTARGGLTAGVVGSRIYTFGGEGNPSAGARGVWNQTEVYDVERDAWESLPAMKVPRHGTSAVGVGGRVFIPGGGIVQGLGATNVFDVFYP